MILLFAVLNLLGRGAAYEPPSLDALVNGAILAVLRGLAIAALMIIVLSRHFWRQAWIGFAWGSGCFWLSLLTGSFACLILRTLFLATGNTAPETLNYMAAVFLWEEFAKSLPILLLVFARGKVRKFVESFLGVDRNFFAIAAFAVFAGLGFAVIENVGYLGFASIGHDAVCGPWTTSSCLKGALELRTEIAPLTHPFYCLVTALGIWLATEIVPKITALNYARPVGRMAPVIATLVLFCVSVSLHKYFNEHSDAKSTKGPIMTVCVLGVLAGSRLIRIQKGPSRA